MTVSVAVPVPAAELASSWYWEPTSPQTHLHVDLLRLPLGPEAPEELQDSSPGLQRVHLQLEVDKVSSSSVHDQLVSRKILSQRFLPVLSGANDPRGILHAAAAPLTH